MVEKDIASGSLVVLNVDDVPPSGFMLTLSAYHQASEPPGPAGRWLIDHLKDSWNILRTLSVNCEFRARIFRSAGFDWKSSVVSGGTPRLKLANASPTRLKRHEGPPIPS
jgi:hypothetical protein